MEGRRQEYKYLEMMGKVPMTYFIPKHSTQDRGGVVLCFVLVEKNVVCFSQAVPKELHSPKGVSAALISLGLQYNGSGPI